MKKFVSVNSMWTTALLLVLLLGQARTQAPGVCTCRGDPHCFGYDADKTDPDDEMFIIQRACWYTLSRDNCGDPTAEPNFHVEVNFHITKPGLARSHVEALRITKGGMTVYVPQGSTLATFSAFTDFSFAMTDIITLTGENAGWREGTEEVLDIDLGNGYRVLWDNVKEVKVNVPDSMRGQVCGICGNFDGDKTNDMQLGVHTGLAQSDTTCPNLMQSGTFMSQAVSLDMFVSSWLSDVDDDEPFCSGGPGCEAPISKPYSCKDVYDYGNTESGVYNISVVDPETEQEISVDVYCDQVTDGGGWIVLQRRMDGSVNFRRNWNDYKFGFGDKEGEFWMGNKYIHALTAEGDMQLRFDLETWDGEHRFAQYTEFSLAAESDNYEIHIQDYSGNAGDAMSPEENHLSFGAHHGMAFSTIDRDNDVSSINCADRFHGGWWYNSCHLANINGLYGSTSYSQGINWYPWKDHTYSLKFTEMKFRPQPE